MAVNSQYHPISAFLQLSTISKSIVENFLLMPLTIRTNLYGSLKTKENWNKT
jgi:hypothetical protein